jgi:hypothetical protein
MRKHVNRIYPFRPPLNKCFITRFLSAKSPYRTTVIGDCLTKKNPRSKISSHNPFILYIVNTFFYFLHFSSPLKFAKKDWLLTCSRICQVRYRKIFLAAQHYLSICFSADMSFCRQSKWRINHTVTWAFSLMIFTRFTSTIIYLEMHCFLHAL